PRVPEYTSTLGGRYPAERVAQSAEVFFRAFGPEAFFLVLTSSDEKRLAPLALALNKNGRERGKHWQVQPAPACEVPRWLAAGDWALLVLADNMTGVVQPIKFAEYLAVGLPVLTHPANSELVRLVAQYRVGAVLDSSMRPDQLRQSLLAEHDKKRARCLEVAREHFNIEKFAGSYASFYRTED
ncbi:MAG: hypothetical protein U9P14_07550, partial [Gemmatimonadota bacterium]|nr:hypothetical protein [Gemmatimonadota bacterium]